MAKQFNEEQQRVRNSLLEITTRRFWQDYLKGGGNKLPIEIPENGTGRFEVIIARKVEKEFIEHMLDSMVGIFWEQQELLQKQQELLQKNSDLFSLVWEMNTPPREQKQD